MSGYLGNQPVPQATQTRDAFTATAGQTSFATRGYTPNFLDVFLNGVKLAAADYTATNGSDVVLASGAVVNDILEVVAYTAFDTANVTGATNFTVTGAFTSQGIDDNGNATALTIDSSENILAGKTSSAFNTAGFELFGNADKGKFWATRDGGVAAAFNRKSSEGDVALFAKDGTTVGSVGVEVGSGTNHLVISTPQNAGNLVFKGNDTGGTETRLAIVNVTGSEAVRPYNSYSDNKYDLGSSSRRFKDLYLSGGVYLGGTGAANKLSDVETGTWTPTVVFSGGGSPIYARQLATYTKIGRFVFCDIAIIFQKNNCSGNLSIENFPFSNTSGNDRGCVTFGYFQGLNGIPIGMIGSGNAKCDIRTALNSTSYNDDLNGNAHITNGFLDAETNFHFSITYKTN